MSVHMVRVLCEPPRGEAETAIANWVSNYNEWTSDPEEHSLSETNTALDESGVTYLVGGWRFVRQGEDPTNILADLSDRLASLQGGLWHRLAYHICDHDGEPDPEIGGGCAIGGWGNVKESGDIPPEMPTFEVRA